MVTITDLIGKKIYRVGRAAAMCWIHIGKPIKMMTRGEMRVVGEYALHIDCPWRLLTKDSSEIVLGSADIFCPSSSNEQDQNFVWDVQGNNLFDEKAERIFSKLSEIIIQSAEMSPINDLTLTLSNGLLLQCYVNQSSDEECWRLFKPNQNAGDLIVTGQGIKYL